MTSKPRHFRALLEAVFQRMARLAVLRTVGNALLFAGIFGWSIVILLPATTRPIALMAGGIAGCVLSLLILLLHHPSRMLAASACDRAAGAAELFSTALLLQGKWQSADPAWRKSVLAQADHAAARLDPRNVRIGRLNWRIATIGAVLLLSFWFWPASILTTDEAGQTTPDLASVPAAANPSANQVAPRPTLIDRPSAASPASVAPAEATAADDHAAPPTGSGQRGSNAPGSGEGEASSGRRPTTSPPPAPASSPRPSPQAATGTSAGSASAGRVSTAPAGSAENSAAVVKEPGRGAAPAAGVSGALQAENGTPLADVPAPYRDIAREYLSR